MKLSIIIVNYNVKHFLEQCLYSVFSATAGIDSEVFVVDNNSVDGSCAMVREKFKDAKLIANTQNYGFSYANNQAIVKASGEYILLLNPDTVVQENTFQKVVAFMDAHRDAGGLGVKMIDGKGRFLPESKRGLPTPAVAFYKVFGISRLFPKSKLFGRYHLSYLDKDKTHEVDVLSGAFMLLRKSLIDQIGSLDEDYFMYGEDIDLSYRITKAGYKNYYYPETTIIHYKGESTKKGSINYVVVFYKAMMIFSKKHFSTKNARLFSLLINMAIYFRAFIAIAFRFLLRMASPLLDFSLTYLLFLLITPLWGMYKWGETETYPPEFFTYAVPAYILTWLITLIFAGGYDRPLKLGNIIKGIAIGTAIILMYYSLLPEHLRFSRALILLGAAGAFLLIPIGRILLHLTKMREFRLSIPTAKRTLIAGKKQEIKRVRNLLDNTDLNKNVVGYVNSGSDSDNGFYLGHLQQIEEIVKIHRISEIIFSARDIASRDIIKFMLLLADYKLDYKIAGPDGLTVIGSNSVHTAGDLYSININSIGKPENKRKKRLLDISLSVITILISPVLVFLMKRPGYFMRNIVLVLFGLKSFIGYNRMVDTSGLPVLRPGILNPLDPLKGNETAEMADKSNIIYAKDYSVFSDIILISQSIKQLDRASA